MTPATGEASGDQVAFERFVEDAGPRLGRALAAVYGFEDGRDTTAEALAYAWGELATIQFRPGLIRAPEAGHLRR
jgi:DNA-directed RNA polymerase specialized sigma24 family protein